MKKSFFVCVVALCVAFITALVLCAQALIVPQAVFSSEDCPTVIAIDAGHGGIDGGVCGVKTGVKESDLNLALAKRLRVVLEDFGFETVLTRNTENGRYDTTKAGFKKRDMQKRKEILLKANPALVISLHQNFYPTKTARGAQVFYLERSEKGKEFALLLQEKLNNLYAKEGVKDRNSSKGEFFMLECCPVPSVLIECGFLSSEKDEKLLLSSGWQNQICQTIASGVLAYFSKESL